MYINVVFKRLFKQLDDFFFLPKVVSSKIYFFRLSSMTIAHEYFGNKTLDNVYLKVRFILTKLSWMYETLATVIILENRIKIY